MKDFIPGFDPSPATRAAGQTDEDPAGVSTPSGKGSPQQYARPAIDGFDPRDATQGLREATRGTAQADGETTGVSAESKPDQRRGIDGFDPGAATADPTDDSNGPGSASGGDAVVAANAVKDQGSVPTARRDDMFQGVVVGRRRQHRLDLELVNGSITDVDSRSIVLGVFQHVKPEGAAATLDKLLGGAITRFTERRLYSAGLGEIFILPTGTHPVRAEFAVFAGLGSFDRFSDESQKLVATNVIRSLIFAGIDEFATVHFGGGSADTSLSTLRKVVEGFVEGLLEADHRHSFRRVILCELDKGRYQAMRQALYGLASTSLMDEIELTINETVPPTAVVAREPAAGEVISKTPTPIYLTVRQTETPSDPGVFVFQTSALTTGNKATVMTRSKHCDKQQLLQLLGELESISHVNLDGFGDELMKLVFDDEFLELLADESFSSNPFVIVHDIASSTIPWEAMRLGNASPAIDRGITRQYMAENMTIAKWLENRRIGPTLDILLVVNPTEDLRGAKNEGERLGKELSALPRVRVTTIEGREATKERLLAEFQSGEYDVIHYAGHAEFDPLERGRSGIICAGKQVLAGEDLIALANLPALVFFNACESGRLFDQSSPQNSAGHNRAGFAEAFLRGGVANFVGTYWPVQDKSAIVFAQKFYLGLVDGKPLGVALTQARNAVLQLGSNDWADYMLYGSPDFSLKRIS